MGNSHRHAHEKVPVILVGGIDGTFKGNRHLVFPDNTQRTSNMLLSILHLYGIEQDKIGTSTGPAAAARNGMSSERSRHGTTKHASREGTVYRALAVVALRGLWPSSWRSPACPRRSVDGRRGRRSSRRKGRCGRSSSRTARPATASTTTRTTRSTVPGGTRSSTPSTTDLHGADRRAGSRAAARLAGRQVRADDEAVPARVRRRRRSRRSSATLRPRRVVARACTTCHARRPRERRALQRRRWRVRDARHARARREADGRRAREAGRVAGTRQGDEPKPMKHVSGCSERRDRPRHVMRGCCSWRWRRYRSRREAKSTSRPRPRTSSEPGTPVQIRLIRWSTDEERAPLVAALTVPAPAPAAPRPRDGAAAAGRGRAAAGRARPRRRPGPRPGPAARRPRRSSPIARP